MNKKILGIMLFVSIVIILTTIVYLTKPKFITLEEETVTLKEITDSKKIIYNTDNAIIKVDRQELKNYLLSEMENWKNYNKNNINSDSVKEIDEFIKFLNNNDEKEIDLTKTPYTEFIQKYWISDSGYFISNSLIHGRAQVYNKNNDQNVKFIKFKIIMPNRPLDSYSGDWVNKFYFPDGTQFFELKHSEE